MSAREDQRDRGHAEPAPDPRDRGHAPPLRRLLARLPPVRAELAVFAIAAAVYSLWTAPGVAWMDSGELTAAVFTLGGGHPPGEPVHTLLGKLFTLLPLGEVAFRVNLLSALSMAASLAGVVAVARRLAPASDQRAAAATGVVAAALAGLAPATLINATRAEVYAPTAALLLWSLAATLDVCRAPAERADGRRFLLAGLGCALAAAIHPLIAAAAALPMAVALITTAGRRLLRLGGFTVALGILALASYAYLPARALAASPPLFAWGTPTSGAALWNLVTGAAYRGNFGLSGALGRFSGLWLLVGQGAGLGLVIGGVGGLAFGAVTRLRGAALALAVCLCVVAGAALQGHLNPDLPGYVLPALLVAAAGLAPLVVAILRLLPAELGGPGARMRPLAMAVVLVPLGAAGLAFGHMPDLDRSDDATRLWAATVARMPPGPGLYVATGDASLFADQYERLVAGGRPDIALANPEMCRDEWYLRHVKRMMPALYVPYVDDGVRGRLAARLAVSNMRKARPVGGDDPAFGPLQSALARPLDRGYLYLLEKGDAGPGQAARPPPDYTGSVGRRVAARMGLFRAAYEEERGRFADAARAGGMLDRFAPSRRERLRSATPRPDRPALRPLLPAMTPLIIHAPWVVDVYADDLAWQAGLDAPRPRANPTPELRLLDSWRALLTGKLAPGAPGLLDLGHPAAAATVGLLLQVGNGKALEKQLRAMLARWPDDSQATALLGTTVANRGDLAQAEMLLRRAVKLDPRDADARAWLGVVLAHRGKNAEAKATYQNALSIDPGVGRRVPAP